MWWVTLRCVTFTNEGQGWRDVGHQREAVMTLRWILKSSHGCGSPSKIAAEEVLICWKLKEVKVLCSQSVGVLGAASADVMWIAVFASIWLAEIRKNLNITLRSHLLLNLLLTRFWCRQIHKYICFSLFSLFTTFFEYFQLCARQDSTELDLFVKSAPWVVTSHKREAPNVFHVQREPPHTTQAPSMKTSVSCTQCAFLAYHQTYVLSFVQIVFIFIQKRTRKFVFNNHHLNFLWSSGWNFCSSPRISDIA